MRLKFLDCVDLINKSPVLSDVQISYVSTSAANSSGIITERIEGYDFKDRPSRANLTAVTGDVLFARMAATKKSNSHRFFFGRICVLYWICCCTTEARNNYKRLPLSSRKK